MGKRIEISALEVKAHLTADIPPRTVFALLYNQMRTVFAGLNSLFSTEPVHAWANLKNIFSGFRDFVVGEHYFIGRQAAVSPWHLIGSSG